MKRFITKICLFIGLMWFAAWGTDSFVSYRLRHNDTRMLKAWNDLYNRECTADVVINGNSRAWVQYNPDILDSVSHVVSYNLGIDGSGINRQIIKYWAYCRLWGAPACLIQNIDHSTLFISFGYEREQFFPYFHYDPALIRDMDVYERFSFAECYVPCYRYIGYDHLLKASLGIEKLYEGDTLRKGYYGRNWEWDGSLLRLQDSVIFERDPEALSLFVDFIDSVQSMGTRVVFVHAPLYIGAIRKMKRPEDGIRLYDSIASLYGIPVLDYRYCDISMDSVNFYNATHMNRRGSCEFSRILAHDLDSLDFFRHKKDEDIPFASNER